VALTDVVSYSLPSHDPPLSGKSRSIMSNNETNRSAAHRQRLRLQSDVPQWMGYWLLLGMWWLLVGLAASPVGDKIWNRGKPYHDSLLVLFVLPALWWVWKRRAEFARRFIQAAEGPLLLLFLAGAAVSVAWANYGHLGDAVIVLLYIGLFVMIWAALVVGNPQWFQRLLFLAGIGLALSALFAMTSFRSLTSDTWQEQGRLVAFGSLDNPNLAAFAYGAALVWLMQSAVRKRLLQVLQLAAVLVLSVFIVMTFSRAAWLAIVVSQICMLLTVRHRHIKWRAMVALIGTVVALALGGWHYVEERGMSYRPQILHQAWDLIEAHPWGGLGMGSRYTIQLGDQVWLHSHNVFSHLAIILGVPGLLVWSALWLVVGWRGWRFRHIATGRCLLALWVYASVAFQFDAPDVLEKPSVEWLLGWLPIAISMGLAWRMHYAADAAKPSRVSLIVLTYNWPNALQQVLRSIAAQTRLPDEVIVADDGSTGATREVIEAMRSAFPVPLLHVWQEDLGFRAARARNEGIAASSGVYVVLIDGDMVLHPSFVADHLMLAARGHFLQGGRFKTTAQETARLLAGGRPIFAPWAAADFHVFDGIRRIYALRAPWLARWKANGRNGGRVMSCNMSFWRSDLLRVNGFDERMEGYGAEDRELAARLGNAGVRRRQVKWAALAAHLEHATRAQPDVDDMSLPNNRLFRATLTEHITRCECGIDRHPPPPVGAEAAHAIN
jgi:O-antigen ligase